MTSPERLAGLVGGVEHVLRHELPGVIVECGVWKRGSMMAAAFTCSPMAVVARCAAVLGDEPSTLRLFDAPTEPTVIIRRLLSHVSSW